MSPRRSGLPPAPSVPNEDYVLKVVPSAVLVPVPKL
jgi:hypothetical protein